MRKRKRKKESKSFRRSGLVTGLGPIRQLQEHKLDLALELKLKQNAIQCDAMLLYSCSSSSSSKESKKSRKADLPWSGPANRRRIRDSKQEYFLSSCSRVEARVDMKMMMMMLKMMLEG